LTDSKPKKNHWLCVLSGYWHGMDISRYWHGMDTSENDSTIRLITDDAAMTDEYFGDVADDYVSDEDVLVIWGPFKLGIACYSIG
jgi:hypothetical protein